MVQRAPRVIIFLMLLFSFRFSETHKGHQQKFASGELERKI
ncbi:hypothetical protein D1AOALGA4SA_1476 [Olavius algarvensis Delta 1 endosymbiont]|nr:hypothetical protein D1AOALGA4SA_1476 [Olavius algarvensis Delta 1 endosymbiont]